MNERFLVIGATGKVGTGVVEYLTRQKYKVRAAVRNLSHAEMIKSENVEIVHFDFLKSETYKQAFRNINRMFLMIPDELPIQNTPVLKFIDQAVNTGVERIVFLSILYAEDFADFPHYEIEQYIESSGVEFTFVRPTFFMQNFSTYYRDGIKNRNEIFLPAGRGKTSFIDTRDISAVIARALEIERDINDKRFELTGPQALDHFEVASIISKVTGKHITYQNPSVEEYAGIMREQGESESEISTIINLYSIVRDNMTSEIFPTVKNFLGRDPITFEKYAKDYADSWK